MNKSLGGSGCASPEAWLSFAEGRLSDDAVTSIADHAEHCEGCSRRLTNALRDSELIKHLSAKATISPAANSETFVSGGSASPYQRVLQRVSEQNSMIRDVEESAEPIPDRLAQYEVLGVIARGGMGVVLRGHDSQLNRPVAIKIMRERAVESPASRARFFREARAVAALRNDFIMPIYQVGEDAGRMFVVMPLLEGETLDARLKRKRQLSLAEVLRIGIELGEALVAAHGVGILHRDVKPSNIWIEEQAGRVKLLDFGLASVSDPGHQNLTLSGQILGTPGYLSPEQAEGKSGSVRSDLFSLGCVLFEMLIGRSPFAADGVFASLKAVVETPAPSIRRLRPDLPIALSELVEQLLAKSPSDRPSAASDVVSQLKRLQAIGCATRSHSPLAAPFLRWPPTRTVWLACGCLATLLLVAFLVYQERFVRYKDGQGKEIKLPLPADATDIQIVRPPRVPIATGTPLVRFVDRGTYVTAPAVLPGVESWDLIPSIYETVDRFQGVVSADKRWLSVYESGFGSGDRIVRVFDLQQNRLARAFHHPVSQQVCFSPDGLRVACIVDARKIEIWDIAEGRLLGTTELESEAINLSETGMAWIPGTNLFVVRASSQLIFINSSDGIIDDEIALPPDTGNSYWLSPSPDGQRIAFATAGCLLVIDRLSHQLQSKIVDADFEGQAYGWPTVWSPDGKQLFAAAARSLIVDTSSWQIQRRLDLAINREKLIWPPGRPGPQSGPHQLDLAVGTIVRSLPKDTSLTEEGGFHLRRTSSGIVLSDAESGKRRFRFTSPTGKRAAGAIFDSGRKAVLSGGAVLDLTTGTLVRMAAAVPGDGVAFLVSPDQQMVFCYGSTSVVSLLSGERHDGIRYLYDWSPDSRQIVGTDILRTSLCLVDRENMDSQVIHTITDGSYIAARFGKSGKSVFAYRADGVLEVWDLPSRRMKTTVSIPISGYNSAYTLMTDATVDDQFICIERQLWDLTKKERIPLPGSPFGWAEDETRIYQFGSKWAETSWPSKAVIEERGSTFLIAPVVDFPRAIKNGWLRNGDLLTVGGDHPRLTLLEFSNGNVLGSNNEGHYFATTPVSSELVYVVRQAGIQCCYSPQEFAEKTGFRLDASRALIDVDKPALQSE